MATHSSVLAWRILGTREPGGLPSLGSHRVGHDWSNLAAAAAAWYQGLCPLQQYHATIHREKLNPLKTAAAAAKSLQSCPTLCNPIDGSPPGSPVPGILQQEHWSGLPFPSPMHGSEKWKWICSVVSDPQRPHGLQPSRLLHPWDFPGKSAGVECHCLLRTEDYYRAIIMTTCNQIQS